jgi:hypothetical protein
LVVAITTGLSPALIIGIKDQQIGFANVFRASVLGWKIRKTKTKRADS